MSDKLVTPARPVYIVAAGSCVGREECAGPLGECFDMTDTGGTDRFGMDSFERAEAQMQRVALDVALGRAGIEPADADAIFSGDLQNQCAASAYATAAVETPHFGLFGACSTSAEALILASTYAAATGGTAIALTSSHNCTAERQFRFPLEYGAQRPQTAQWTVTGAGAFVVSADRELTSRRRAANADDSRRRTASHSRRAVKDSDSPDRASVPCTAGDEAVRAFAAYGAGSSGGGDSAVFAENVSLGSHDPTDGAPGVTPTNIGGVASPDRSTSAELAPPYPETSPDGRLFPEIPSDAELAAECAFAEPAIADPPAARYQPTSPDRTVEIVAMLPGISRDYGVSDASDMGAAMAPAACDTIARYFVLSGRGPKEFDMIVTGDLGVRGKGLVSDLLAARGVDCGGVLDDCGAMIYDVQRQDKHSGGSGCGCSAAVLASYILPKMRSGELSDVLFVATGALMNPQAIMQGENIVGIAHLVHLKAGRRAK